MLQTILNFKHGFSLNCQNEITSFSSFTNLLLIYSENNPINIPQKSTYWNNYFHATLISSLFELVGQYDLELWNQNFASDHLFRVNNSLQITNGNEGEIFELFILHSINYVFEFNNNPLRIKALRATNKKGTPRFFTEDSLDHSYLNPKENEYLLENLTVNMKIHGSPMKRIWGDNDIVVTLIFGEKIQQFCIISCKISLRERVYQSIFWATHSRLESIGKHVLITLDKGAGGNTEIGSRNNNKLKKQEM